MAEHKSAQHRLGATELRANLATLLNRVHNEKEHLVVEKLGIPVAVVISMEDYEHYKRLLAANVQGHVVRPVGAGAEEQDKRKD